MSENKLKKVTDEALILSLLSGAKEKSCEVFIWKIVGSEKHLGHVRIESLRKARKDFCIVPVDGQDRIVQDLMSGNTIIDLYVPDSALLLRCSIKQTDAPFRYYLQLPTFVALAERRKSFRLKVQEEDEVKISFGKTVNQPRPMSQHFHKSCFDVSTGGFSFFISKPEAKFFEKGDLISQLDLKAGKWSTKITAEVAMIKEVEPDELNGLHYKAWRVSCRISQIDQISRKYLEKFIFERIKEELHAINE